MVSSRKDSKTKQPTAFGLPSDEMLLQHGLILQAFYAQWHKCHWLTFSHLVSFRVVLKLPCYMLVLRLRVWLAAAHHLISHHPHAFP